MAIMIFRWIAFLVAGITLVSVFVLSPYRPISGPFRFFEVWVLMLSFFAMGRMMAIVERRSTREWPALVAAVAALNATVVALYLAGVIGPQEARMGLPLPELLLLSLYLAAPLLQCADVLFVHSGVMSVGRAAMLLVIVMGLYLLWIEQVVRQLSDEPWGEKIDGLPYWSLNDLAGDERVFLYAGVAGLALFALVTIFAIQRVTKRDACGVHD